MNTKIHIKASEPGMIRVFHIDLPHDAIERFTKQAGTGEWPLKYALGATDLRPTFVEVIDLRDLGDMSLSDYLAQAHDLTSADFADMRHRLDAIRGFVLVLSTQAFDRTEQHLSISAPLRWIGSFAEPAAAMGMAPLQSDAALGRNGTADQTKTRQAAPNAVWVVLGLFVVIPLAILAARLFLN